MKEIILDLNPEKKTLTFQTSSSRCETDIEAVMEWAKDNTIFGTKTIDVNAQTQGFDENFIKQISEYVNIRFVDDESAFLTNMWLDKNPDYEEHFAVV